MKKLFTHGFAILALSSLLFANLAFATTTGEVTDPYTDTDNFTMTIEGSLNSDGYAELSWNQYEGGDLKWYKVVQSQTNMDAKYPMDGYVQAISDPAVTSFTHTGVKEGTNYYRVCAINEDYLRACSNTLTLESAVTVEEPVVDNTPTDPYTDDPDIQLILTGELNSLGKADLNWEMYEGGDLKWYKIVHSQTNQSAYYPTDGYVGVISDAATTTYLHTSVPEGTNYYRVCVITDDDRRGCSNTVTLTKGDVVAVQTFDDIETHWAKEYIEDLAAEGVVEGRDGNYEPDEPVLRAEAIKMILKGLGYSGVTCDSTLFPDLESSDWYCEIVTKAYLKGFIAGSNGLLEPGRYINRAEAVKILLEAKGVELVEIDFDPFSDVFYVQWYAKYVYKANTLGYVEGVNGEFLPDQPITRAELAKIVSLAGN